MTDHIGQTFGHYRLTRLLGRGGFADVYLGEHMYLGTLAAIKVLNAQLTVDEVEQFRQEARTIAQLEHLHIIRVLDFGVDDNVPFLVMGYAPNGTLRQRYPRGTRLPLEKILHHIRDIAGALQYAHDQKLIHRDVKPENMLLGRNEEVLLSDFGLAVVAHSSSQERPGDVSGTVTYMAPEQARGKPRPASDQYALGIVVYEWLCGARPFEGSYQEIAVQHVLAPPPPLHRLQPTISPALEEVVLKALAKDPHERYPRVQDFAHALEQAAQGEKSPTVIFPAPQLRPVGGALDSTTNRHPSDTVYALASSPDGRSLASASLDKTIQVWNPSSGNRLSTYDGHAGMDYALAWSPDGKRIASTSGGGTDNTVQVWDTATGQNIFTYHDPAYWSRAVAWSPDGKYLAVGLWNEIQLWDIARKSKIATYRSHHSWVRAVAWSPDGRTLASTCEDKTVHIWDPAKERLLLTHRGHTD